jgi:hypothetical protein
MEEVVTSPRDILPCEELKSFVDRGTSLSPEEFFRTPDQEQEGLKPYYIKQKVYSYTPPGSAPNDDAALELCPQQWRETLRDGMDLAEYLREPPAAAARACDRRRFPLLLTGHTGTGKTLLVRHLFHRMLQADESYMRDWRFVRVEGQHLPPASVINEGFPVLAHAVWRALHPDRKTYWDKCSETKLRRVTGALENSPRLLIVLDLNRGIRPVAKEVIKEVTEWQQAGRCQFIVIYRLQSALLYHDEIWMEIDPEKHQGKLVAVEIRDLDDKGQLDYFRAARRAHWQTPSSSNVEENVEEDVKSFTTLENKYSGFLGRPI